MFKYSDSHWKPTIKKVLYRQNMFDSLQNKYLKSADTLFTKKKSIAPISEDFQMRYYASFFLAQGASKLREVKVWS